MKSNFYRSIKESNNEVKNLEEILETIQNGTYRNQIEKLRKLKSIGEDENASELKQSLPAFTVSSTFKSRRKLEYLEDYNGILHLDYDKIDDASKYKEQVKEIPYTLAAFVSPSGNGLKVFVRTTSSLEQHTETFESIKSYYDNILGVTSDKSVKDVTRLCFVSYDKSMYYNDSAEVFDMNSFMSVVSPEWVWNYSTRFKPFEEGNRNNVVYYYACNTNRYGIKLDDALSFALSYSEGSFNQNEIEQTVKSAYENNASEWKKLAGSSITSITSEKEPEYNPIIPEIVYKKLPDTLKIACDVFEGRERDVFLTSALSVISGGLHNVEGVYMNEIAHPNLFSFIIAPPASGKSSMKFSRQLGECYHEYLISRSKEEISNYKKQKKLFDRKLKKAVLDEEIMNLDEPKAPKSKLFFLPGNTSSSMLIKHLEQNDGMGAIVENEADTLSATLKQDWGGFSDIIRKGFHGETITKSRITDMEYNEIKKPKFSVTLTGTPNQLEPLIKGVDDGLFSRFLFYRFKATPTWKDAYAEGIRKTKEELFSEYSAWLCDKFKDDKKRCFNLTPTQWNILNNTFSKALNYNHKFYSDNATGITFRLGLMTYKIAMVLSAIRSDEDIIHCIDDDFEIALTLVNDVYMHHILSLLVEIHKHNPSYNEFEKSVLGVIGKVPIKRGDIFKAVQKLGVTDRTLSDYLRKFVTSGLIKKVKRGTYVRNK